MKIIPASFDLNFSLIEGTEMVHHIERCARVCYKTEKDIDNYNNNTAEKMVKSLIKNGHLSMLEHASFSVLLTVSRSFTHDLVRHRLCSFAQESQRFCSYDKDKFGNEIIFIKPCYFEEDSYSYRCWKESCEMAEKAYFNLIDCGKSPQAARMVLPNSVKADIVITANLREWRHIFELRAAGTTGSPSPEVLEIMIPLLKEVQKQIPYVFDNVIPYVFDNIIPLGVEK